jgi:hypothetical protein
LQVYPRGEREEIAPCDQTSTCEKEDLDRVFYDAGHWTEPNDKMDDVFYESDHLRCFQIVGISRFPVASAFVLLKFNPGWQSGCSEQVSGDVGGESLKLRPSERLFMGEVKKGEGAPGYRQAWTGACGSVEEGWSGRQLNAGRLDRPEISVLPLPRLAVRGVLT